MNSTHQPVSPPRCHRCGRAAPDLCEACRREILGDTNWLGFVVALVGVLMTSPVLAASGALMMTVATRALSGRG